MGVESPLAAAVRAAVAADRTAAEAMRLAREARHRMDILASVAHQSSEVERRAAAADLASAASHAHSAVEEATHLARVVPNPTILPGLQGLALRRSAPDPPRLASFGHHASELDRALNEYSAAAGAYFGSVPGGTTDPHAESIVQRRLKQSMDQARARVQALVSEVDASSSSSSSSRPPVSSSAAEVAAAAYAAAHQIASNPVSAARLRASQERRSAAESNARAARIMSNQASAARRALGAVPDSSVVVGSSSSSRSSAVSAPPSLEALKADTAAMVRASRADPDGPDHASHPEPATHAEANEIMRMGIANLATIEGHLDWIHDEVMERFTRVRAFTYTANGAVADYRAHMDAGGAMTESDFFVEWTQLSFSLARRTSALRVMEMACLSIMSALRGKIHLVSVVDLSPLKGYATKRFLSYVSLNCFEVRHLVMPASGVHFTLDADDQSMNWKPAPHERKLWHIGHEKSPLFFPISKQMTRFLKRLSFLRVVCRTEADLTAARLSKICMWKLPELRQVGFQTIVSTSTGLSRDHVNRIITGSYIFVPDCIVQCRDLREYHACKDAVRANLVAAMYMDYVHIPWEPVESNEATLLRREQEQATRITYLNRVWEVRPENFDAAARHPVWSEPIRPGDAMARFWEHARRHQPTAEELARTQQMVTSLVNVQLV
jgi:hypothetical protein